MIVRMSSARIRPGRAEAFRELIVAMVADFPSRYDGLLGHEVLIGLHQDNELVYVSRWRDEDSLARFAGPDWRTAPVTFPNEDDYLTEPLAISHFTLLVS